MFVNDRDKIGNHWSISKTAFPLKPLGQMILNMIRSIYGRSSIEIAHFVLIHKQTMFVNGSKQNEQFP
jgi:hypothetical protein